MIEKIEQIKNKIKYAEKLLKVKATKGNSEHKRVVSQYFKNKKSN